MQTLLKQEEKGHFLGTLDFGAVVSVCGSRTECVGLSQNELQCVCSW